MEKIGRRVAVELASRMNIFGKVSQYKQGLVGLERVVDSERASIQEYRVKFLVPRRHESSFEDVC